MLPVAVVSCLCPLPAPSVSLFSTVPPALSPSSAASFLPRTLSLFQAVRRSQYYDVAWFVEQGADVTAADEADSEDSNLKDRGGERSDYHSGLTLTDEVMRVALAQVGQPADESADISLAGGDWPAILLLLLQHGAPATLSASLTASMCGLASSSDGQLRWAIFQSRFLAIVHVALRLLQQRHAEQRTATAATNTSLVATHQQRQDRLVDALTRLQMEEEKEGRERNRQTATKLRYQMMATQLRERERRRQQRREGQLTMREAAIRASYEERAGKVRSLLAEIERVKAEDTKLSREVEARRLQLHDTTSTFDAWLKRRQAERAELLRMDSEVAAMDDELRTVRRQRDEIRELRTADGKLRLQRQRVTVECGAADVQFVMEKRRNQHSHLFFRFHRALRPASTSTTSTTPLSSNAPMLHFEAEPCVESAVFPAAAASASASMPPSASSLSNPSWPPLSIDVYSLCGGDESASFRILLCDSDSTSPTPRSRTASVRSASLASSAAAAVVSPSSHRYVSVSSAVAVVGVAEASVAQLRRSGGGGVHVLLRVSEKADAALAGVFRFISVMFVN